MKFSISVSLERFDPSLDMRAVVARSLELVRMAEEGGFEIAWTPEHHTIEFTIAPNPFSILTHWAAHTKRIRLGTAVVTAPYWHPIRLAGEAGMLDVVSDGRLEFGIGRGVVRHLADRVAIMYLGRIVELGQAQSIYNVPRHPYTIALLDSVPKLVLEDEAVVTFRPIRGEPPSPLSPPTGCHFHQRCPIAQARCRSEVPALRPIGSGRTTACHLVTPNSFHSSAPLGPKGVAR